MDWLGGMVGKRKARGKDGPSLENQVVGLLAPALISIPSCPGAWALSSEFQ